MTQQIAHSLRLAVIGPILWAGMYNSSTRGMSTPPWVVPTVISTALVEERPQPQPIPFSAVWDQGWPRLRAQADLAASDEICSTALGSIAGISLSLSGPE